VWHLALDQLGVVGGDAVGDVGQGEVGRDSVEQELAEALPDFDLLTLAVVGEGVGDGCRVVFTDDIVLGVGGGEDDGSTHGHLGAEEGAGGYILVVDQGSVDSVEGCVRDYLAGDVVSFSVGGGFSGGHGRIVARDLVLGLGVHGRDKLACSRLPSLRFLLQVLLSFDVGGVWGMFGWWVQLGDGCFSGVGVCAVLVPLLVGGLLALYLFSVAPFPFLFFSLFGLGPVLLGPPVGLAVAAGPCAAERSCCCIWVTQVPSVAIFLVRLFVAI